METRKLSASNSREITTGWLNVYNKMQLMKSGNVRVHTAEQNFRLP